MLLLPALLGIDDLLTRHCEHHRLPFLCCGTEDFEHGKPPIAGSRS